MSSEQIGHPDEGLLLRYADGELGESDARGVREHVEGCVRCRMELDEIEAAAQAFGRQQAELPPPPAAWGDLARGFDLADAAAAKPAWTSARKWLPVAAGLVVAWVAANRLMDTPSARAAELLRKAAAAEAPARKARRIQIRTKTLRLTRVLGTQAANAADRAALDSLESQFREARYSWDDPLSAKSFADWRDGLSEKQDSISTVREAEKSWFQIRTTTESGQLREASLKLRTEDLRAVEGTLEFRNQERVEISELADETAPSPEPSPRIAGRIETSPEPPVVAREIAPATAGDELRVFAALHRLKADLGEPVEVTRSEGKVLVTGVGLDAQRAEEIRGAVEAIPRVAVRFSEPSAAAPPEEGGARSAASQGEVSGLQSQLEKTLGGRAVFEQFSEVVLEKTDALMARGHALRRLSQRFSPESEAQLNAEERQMLAGLRKDLSSSFGQQQREIERVMAPALRGRRSTAPAAASGTWQASTEELFQAASKLDRLVAVAFGGASRGGAGPTVAELTARLDELKAATSAYEMKIQTE